MADSSSFAAIFPQLAPDRWRAALESFIPPASTEQEKISAIEAALKSPMGRSMRETMARWIVDEIVPVSRLVPVSYINWRPPVRDAMMFVVARLSPARLAPKLLEQINLPARTSPEVRLLRLIAKVPGLQKLGQVIARNQHLQPALRNALAKLENGIRDVDPADMQVLVERELGSRLKRYRVKIAPVILKEASVSAVMRFTWTNPATGHRQRGVFKILKPHIPEYFSEDMNYLRGLAAYFGERHHRYGFPPHLIPDTFRKVERLLRHEVNFSREQKTLIEAGGLYQSFPGLRVPEVFEPLCTAKITALAEVRGIKITSAAARLPIAKRRRVAEQLLEALIAVPLLAPTKDAVFHGDPHAGNLLYDNRAGQLAIIDWALRERLGSEQRRHLALLFLMMALRDPVGVTNQIVALSEPTTRNSSSRRQTIQAAVSEFIANLPPASMPSAAVPMRLLERVALQGIKFPASLIMLSKVMFTLEGLLGDIVKSTPRMGFSIARHVAQHWMADPASFRSPLKTRDWLALQCSALLFTSRVWIRWEQAMLDRWLAQKTLAASPSR